MPNRPVGNRAIVIGAGIGGLAAAAALAEFFDNVIVFDRDDLPDKPVTRAGVPQGRHLHVLLLAGMRALVELFHGIEHDIVAAGAVPLRAGIDIRYEFPDLHSFPQRDLGWISHSLTRPSLELLVRRALQRLANVEIRPRSRVLELLATPDGTTVRGVRVETSAGPESVAADLVVDASGRGGLTLALLQAHGLPAPEETTIGIGIRYATAVLAIPAGPPRDWKGVLTQFDPRGGRRGALLMPIEGDRWMMILGGVHGDTPPDDWDGFRAFAATLATRTIADAVQHLQPIGPIVRYALEASVRRHFERLPSFPRGLLATGDAISLFNPLYGQGMSVRAQEGLLLRTLLGRLNRESTDPLGGLAHAFFAEAQPLTDTPWWNAALPDLVYPETTGDRPPEFATILQYGAALRRLAAQDADVHRLMLEVQHLLQPRSALAEPMLAARVRAVMAAA